MAAIVLERIKVVGTLGLGAPLVILLMMMMMVLPLPPFLLDLLFTLDLLRENRGHLTCVTRVGTCIEYSRHVAAGRQLRS